MPSAPLTRREILRTSSSALAVCITGCAASEPPRETGTNTPTVTKTVERTTDVRVSTENLSPTPSPTETKPSPTDTPTAPELPSSSNDHCPPGSEYDEYSQRIICHQDVDQDQFPIYLEPSSETATLPTATFEFTLVNDTTADLSSGPFAWKVHKRIGDDWFILGPLFAYDVGMTVNSGESYEWTMDVDNTALNQPVTDRLGGRDEAILFRGLGAGTYAFGVTGWFDQPNTREDYKHQLAFSSRFDLEGDPLKLTPTETVRETDRSGDTLTVTVTPPSGRRDRDWYEFVVTQVGSPSEEPHRLIAEQVIRETPLRNALAHFEDGIRRVRVLTKTLPMFVVGQPQAVGSDKTTTVEYEGETYTIEVIPSEQSETPSDER